MYTRLLSVGILLLAVLQVMGESHPARSLSKCENPILVSNETSRADQIVLNYHIPEPEFADAPSQRIAGELTQRATISNCPRLKNPGEPEVSRVPVRFILPYGKTVDHIEVVVANTKELTLPTPLSFSEPDRPISSTVRTVTEPSRAIYQSNNQYPVTLYGAVDIQKAFGISIAKVDLYPLTYFAQTRKAEFHEKLRLVVHLKESDPTTDIRIDVERFRERGKLTEENEKALETYPTERVSRETVDYVLITSSALATNTSISPNVDDLITLRKKQGYSCKVVTTEEISSGYSGSAMKDKIRNFIKFAYNNWNTKYVTLGGDIDIVDLFRIRAKYNFENPLVSTDMPFQCLDGDSWDEDFEAEVYVGRLSVENATELSNMLYKIIQYETEPNDEPRLKRSFGAGAHLSGNTTWGKQSIDYLLRTVFPSDWSYDYIYDQDWNKDGGKRWKSEDIIPLISQNIYGHIDNDGHGSHGGIMKIGKDEINLLTNTKYPFIYSLSCLSGGFEVDCIAEHITAEYRTGGVFGGIMNSEVGLAGAQTAKDGSSPEIHRSFWNGFWEQDMIYISQCNAYSHRMNTHERFTCFTTNYFGDAATIIRANGDGAVNLLGDAQGDLIKGFSNITVNAAQKNSLSFNLTSNSDVAIRIFSLSGKVIHSVPAKLYRAGSHTISLDKNLLSSGIFLVQMSSGSSIVSQKIRL